MNINPPITFPTFIKLYAEISHAPRKVINRSENVAIDFLFTTLKVLR